LARVRQLLKRMRRENHQPTAMACGHEGLAPEDQKPDQPEHKAEQDLSY